MTKTNTYFDLNIPTHPSKPHLTNLTLTLLSLGYTSIAHTKTIKGVMSDKDICTLAPPLSLSLSNSTLVNAPSLSLHRDCLNVPRTEGLRQFTRLTVCVESLVQAQALNSGNGVLKSYDVVAARPMSQVAFEHVCSRAEVDIIAIDFSEKLPFRLKSYSIEAAVKRGVYFEIAYSGLIANPQARQQMIPNAKLLVNWTRGRNIILSSAAISASDLRGPIDVANLASLLGLSMERGKDAISKNCRNLVTNSLRKKKYYKEAIKVELVSSTEQSNKNNFSDWLNWDPISSGDGDLQLDDIAKSFATSGKVSKNVKAIDFAKVVDSMPSHGFRVGPVISGVEALPGSLVGKISLSAPQIVEVCTSAKPLSDEHPLREPKQMPFCDISSKSQSSGCQSPSNEDKSTEVLPKIQEDRPCITSAEPCEIHVEEEANVLDEMDMHITIAETNVHEMQPQNQVPSSEVNDVSVGDTRDIEVAASVNANGGEQLAVLSKENDCPVSHANLLRCTTQRESELKDSNDSDMDVMLAKPEEHELQLQNEKTNVFSLPPEIEHIKRQREDADSDTGLKKHRKDPDSVNEFPCVMYSDKMIKDEQNLSVANCEPSEEVTMGTQCREEDNTNIQSPNLIPCEPSEERVRMGAQRTEEDDTNSRSPNLIPSASGNCKPKKRTSRNAFLFPLKRMLNPMHYKKKATKHKSKLNPMHYKKKATKHKSKCRMA